MGSFRILGFQRAAECPVLARLGSSGVADRCPLHPQQETLSLVIGMSQVDPQRTSWMLKERQPQSANPMFLSRHKNRQICTRHDRLRYASKHSFSDATL